MNVIRFAASVALAAGLAATLSSCDKSDSSTIPNAEPPKVDGKPVGGTDSNANADIPWKPGIVYGTLTDSRDDKTYRTVKIGPQTWMAENLAFKAEGADSGWWHNNSPDSGAKYGRFYTWAAAMDLPDSCNSKVCASRAKANPQGLCPDGWHVPNDTEWDTLSGYIGRTTGGIQLRSTAGWFRSGNGTDTYGFRGLPGGNIYQGSSDNMTDGLWWSSTEDSPPTAICRILDYNLDNMWREDRSKVYGFAIRCLAD